MESRLVGGKYEIVRKIGEGGAACIYLATDKSTGGAVALKIPGEDSPKLYYSLKKEYLFAATHIHPSILSPHDIIFDSKKPILVTPFLKGKTIEKYLESLKNESETAAYLGSIKSIFATILEAAGFIHFSGYCYNDFKPSNIIQYHSDGNTEPRIALIDFNLVTSLSESPKRRGTLHYIAPEVLRGEKSTAVSDIYSIGILFYQLLTGNLPFDSPNESDLIESIVERGKAELKMIPEFFRDGLAKMLNRDPLKRPSDAPSAAEALGIYDNFHILEKSLTEYYLTSGLPPFSDDLEREFRSFRKHNRGKVFVVKGYSYSNRSLDFLSAFSRIERIDCLRIQDNFNEGEIADILDSIADACEKDRSEKILFIEDLGSLGNENNRRLARIVKSCDCLHTIAAADRWFNTNLKSDTFDPIKYRNRLRMTEHSLEAFLKRKLAGWDLRPLCESTGGDPEQIFSHLKHIGEKNGPGIRDLYVSVEEPVMDFTIQENETAFRQMVDVLNSEQLELASLLSAWGNEVPLLMLVSVNREKLGIFDTLTRIGIMIQKKDSLSFLSGGLRKYIYNGIPESVKREYHKFWAISSEGLIRDNRERFERTAYHWALSGELLQAFKYNAAAAKHFHKNGEYSRASKFAEVLMGIKTDDPRLRISALKINGDINAASGYLNTARKMYLEILLNESDTKIICETTGELGKLYLLAENYKKSLYYFKKYLECCHETENNNIAGCNNLIALALWGIEDYPLSLWTLLKTSAREMEYYKMGLFEKTADIKIDKYSILKMALDISIELDNYDMIVKAHIELGRFYMTGGYFDRALDQFKKSLEISERKQNKSYIIASLLNLGSCHITSGNLFMAIECFHNARQIAEKYGNQYLKTLAELNLTDISMMMGNYSLALKVITTIENDRIYNEDKLLKLKTDLRKARLFITLGKSDTSLHLAERISRSAAIMNKHDLALQADIVAAESRQEILGTDNLENLKVIFTKSKKRNLTDLIAETQLSLGRYYKEHDNKFNALHYFEDLCEGGCTPGRIKLEAEIHRTELESDRKEYRFATGNLIETESVAAASGFIPIALEAADLLGALYGNSGKVNLYEESCTRADAYREKLLAALPEGYPAEKYRKKLVLSRCKHASIEPTDEETTSPADSLENDRNKSIYII